MSCALTAIAAALLIDGDTAHKALGIPVRRAGTPTDNYYLGRDSPGGQALWKSRLIVVDEVSMMALWQVQMIDRMLRVSARNVPSSVLYKVMNFKQSMKILLRTVVLCYDRTSLGKGTCFSVDLSFSLAATWAKYCR